MRGEPYVTKSQLAAAFARLEAIGLFIEDYEEKYTDLEVNTFENGAAIEYEEYTDNLSERS